MNKLIYILLFLSLTVKAQTYDFTECSINISENTVVRDVEGVSNIVQLQSGTRLTIGTFTGTILFVHGYNALEEGDNYVRPVLKIERCVGRNNIYISSRIRIERSNISLLQTNDFRDCNIKIIRQ